MKTIILFSIFILPSLGGVGGGFYAQTVNIPDPNFKARLIDAGVDTNWDGEIQVSEAEAVTGMLDISIFLPDYPIYDLTGIEAFINITGLDVSGNELTMLDLSYNTLLIELYCIDNNLTYLNVENCVNLEILRAYHNQLTDINLTPNIHLKEIALSQNQLTYLDLRNGNNISITEYFDSRDNPDLICIFVDDAEYSENSSNWYEDPTSTYVETQEECDALSIERNTLETVYLLPNPVQDILYLHIPTENLPLEIDIIDISGKRISSHIIINPKTELDVSFLQSGIYFIILKDNLYQTISTKKLIKL